MNIIAADDEKLALNGVLRVLNEVFPDEQVEGFQNGRKMLEKVKQMIDENVILDYAFLDIKMRGISGLELAKQIKDLCPVTRILFVTAYDEYAFDAFKLHAKGYLLKPLTREMVEETLDSMELNWRDELGNTVLSESAAALEASEAITEKLTIHAPDMGAEEREEGGALQKVISVHTFGNFDVYVNGRPVKFERSKSKELLAYLIDRRGAGSTTAQITAMLWEDQPGGRKLSNTTQQVIYSMMQTLKAEGIADIIVKKWNYLAVSPEKIDCDYYRFLEGDVTAVNSYMGEYMGDYSWAELTTAALERKVYGY